MSSIIVRILKQIRNDKRSLALLIIAPLFILTILYFILGDSDYTPTVASYQLPESFTEGISENMVVNKLDALPDDSYDYLLSNKTDALLYADSTEIKVYMIEQNTKTAKVLKHLQELKATNGTLPMELHYQYETSSDNQLDSLSFVFLGILSFFFVFILSGVSFVSERNNQTLDRMLQSPLSKASIIGGYTIGYGILSTIQGILIILFSAYVLKLHFQGSVALCIGIMVLLAFCAVSTGTLLSIFATNQFQMIQFIPIIIVPQIFFSGLIPLDTIPWNIGKLCYIFPSFYGCYALKNVMVYGYGIDKIWIWLLGLAGYTGILFVLNVLALKKHHF